MSYTKTQWTNDTAPAINDTNLNKIEQGIYDNDSHIGDLTTLTTTADTDLVSAINEVNAKSEIDNTYGTSQTKGYSQEYQNAHNVVVSATEPANKSKVWLQHSSNLWQYGQVSVPASAYSPISKLLQLKSGTAYSLTIQTSDNVTCQILSSDSSGADGTQIKRIDNINPSYTINFTTTTDYTIIRFFRLTTASNNTTVSNIMLNIGSTAIPYETYVQDKELVLNANNTYEGFNPQNDLLGGMKIVSNTTETSNTFRVEINANKPYTFGFLFDADGDIFEFHKPRQSSLTIQRYMGTNTLTGVVDTSANSITFTLSRTSIFFCIYF